MPKAKTPAADPVEQTATTASQPLTHDDTAAYHADQLARLGAGACDVCGKPVSVTELQAAGSSCSPEFHAEQFAALGAGACTVCGHNVAA